MKDLLEVIEEGREEFDEEFGRNWTPETFPHPLGIRNYHTNNTKAILTNQIERMKGELNKKKGYDGNNLESACDYYNRAFTNWGEVLRFEDGRAEALQTQIEYLEDVLDKLKD